MSSTDAPLEDATFAKAAGRLIPLLFLCYIAAFLDRVNVGFAKLQMAGDLHFSDAAYGAGAGIFFIGYFLFEVPSNLALTKIGARAWIARIMITWGLISAAFVATGIMHWGPAATAFGASDAEFSFYLLRFLLGAAEAGFFPGVILYLTFWFPARRRAQMVAAFFAAVPLANVIGSPLSGAILQFMSGVGGLAGWRWLFLLEALPSIVLGFIVLARLPNGPADARWLTPAERDMVIARVDADEAGKRALGHRSAFFAAFADGRLWALSIVYFTGNFCFYAVNFWLPTIVQELGIDKADYLRVGLISMIPWGAALVIQLLWARHSDRTGERRLHAAAGLLLAMTGLVTLAFAGHEAVLSIIALSCVTAGITSYTCVFWSLPTAFLSGAAAAAGIAWINSVGNLGGFFGPDLIGRIRTAAHGADAAGFLALAVAALIGALIILVLPKAPSIGARP